MQRVVPALRFVDEVATRAFYVDGLGFRVDWEHRFGPAMPLFMGMSRDGMTLYLTQHAGDAQPGGLVYFYVDDVDGWFRAIAATGKVALRHTPEDMPWGNREVHLTDPAGNHVRLCTRLAGANDPM